MRGLMPVKRKERSCKCSEAKEKSIKAMNAKLLFAQEAKVDARWLMT